MAPWLPDLYLNAIIAADMNRYQRIRKSKSTMAIVAVFVRHRPVLTTASIAALAALSTAISGCTKSEEKAMASGALAQQQLQAGQIAASRQTVRKAIAQDDDIPQLYVLQGRIELAAKNRDAAFTAYSQALALDAGNNEALQAVAQLGLQAGHAREAQDAVDRMLALNPSDPAALMASGLLQLSENKVAQAELTANQLLKYKPGDAVGLLLKARAQMINGNTAEAMKTIDLADPDAGQAEGVALMRLEVARALRDAPAMMAQFDRLQKLSPDDLDLRADEINLAYKIGDTARARKVLGAALRYPKIDDYWARKLIELVAEYDQAPFDAATLATLGQKTNRQVIEALGRYYIGSRQPAAARSLFSGNSNQAGRAIRVRLDAVAGDDAVALAAADAVLARDKTNCDALLARADVTLRQLKSDTALLAAQTAQGQCPQDTAGWVLLARAYEQKRDAAGVERVFEQGIKANPRQSFLFGQYADWLIANGKSARAVSVARLVTLNAPALVSGWGLYLRIATAARDPAARSEALQGVGRARTMLGIDIPRGEPPAHGTLFQRLPDR